MLGEENLALDQLAPGFAMAIPYATTATPPPARPAGAAPLIDQGIAPGVVRWMVVDLGPGIETPTHHTDTLDLQTVLSGSVDLVLDDGAHHLEPGDLVVLTGVDHAWRAGPTRMPAHRSAHRHSPTRPGGRFAVTEPRFSTHAELFDLTGKAPWSPAAPAASA